MYCILAVLLFTSSLSQCFVLSPLDPSLTGCCPKPNPCLAAALAPALAPPPPITVAPCMDLLTKLKAKLCSKFCGKFALAMNPYLKQLAAPPCPALAPTISFAPPPACPCGY